MLLGEMRDMESKTVTAEELNAYIQEQLKPGCDATIDFHCSNCERDGFVKILGGAPPIDLICPACGHKLGEVQCGFSDPTIYASVIGDPTKWEAK